MTVSNFCNMRKACKNKVYKFGNDKKLFVLLRLKLGFRKTYRETPLGKVVL